MNKKFFIAGLTVLLGVSLFLTGCPTDAETETVTVTVPGMIYLDVDATDEAELEAYLTQPGSLNIGLSGNADLSSLSDDLTVGAGKLVYILNTATLEVKTNKLVIDGGGNVYVGYGGTLDVDEDTNALVSVKSGTVHVVQGGTLLVFDEDSVDNGADSPQSVLGTDAVKITDATLGIKTALAALTDVPGALNYLSSGELAVTVGVMPSAVTSTAVANWATSATKRLSLTAGTTETTATLTIPAKAGLTVNAKSDDALTSVTGLTVAEGGSFAAAAGTGNSAGTGLALTVNGRLHLGGAVGKLLDSTVGANGLLSLSGATITFDGSKKVSVVDGSTVYSGSKGIIFPAATDITTFVTTGGSEAVTIENIEIAANKTFGGGVTVVVGQGKAITLKPTAALYGTFTVAEATIVGGGPAGTGGWRATGEADTVITATDAKIATITGGTLSGGNGSTILQDSGTASNALALGANTTVNLGGTTSAAGAVITLDAASSNPAQLSLTASSKILLGAGTGGNDINAVGTVTIGGKTVTVGSLAVADFKRVGSNPYHLVQIGGTNVGTLTATTTDGDDVPIASNSAVVGS